MDTILNLLHKVDYTTVIASALTFIAGLAIVKSQLVKAVRIIGDLADLLSTLKTALEDGKLNKDEVESIVKEGEELIAGFKK